MDETGFMFGQAGSERVVVPRGEPAARFKAQPGTRESATVIECIGSGGQVLPPLIITKGRVHTVGEQRRLDGVPASWRFAKTVNGWTNDIVGLQWLNDIFEPTTRPSTSSDYRLLIIDGHRSHTSEAFIDACWNSRIIPFLLPAHATHVMQPLDVSIFGPLTGSYRHLVSNAAEQADAVDKAMFGTFYSQARQKILTQARARKAFSDCGITLTPSPEKVLHRLPGTSNAGPQSEPPQRTPMQEQPVRTAASAFNAAVNVLCPEPTSRNIRDLKRTIIEAHEHVSTSLAVSQAESGLLRTELEKRSKLSTQMGKRRVHGDRRVLSQSLMITREEAKRDLVAKGPYRAQQSGDRRQEEEEEEAAPPPAEISNGDEPLEDGNEELLSSSDPIATPVLPQIDNVLDDGSPLSTINDDDEDPFGFFETLPIAGPSRTQH